MIALLGPLLAGALLGAVSARATVAVFAVAALALAVWATLSPAIRAAPSMDELDETTARCTSEATDNRAGLIWPPTRLARWNGRAPDLHPEPAHVAVPGPSTRTLPADSGSTGRGHGSPWSPATPPT